MFKVADVIWLRILRWTGYLGWSGWAQCYHKNSNKGKRETRDTEEEV
jgi:hypothetical protein